MRSGRLTPRILGSAIVMLVAYAVGCGSSGGRYPVDGRLTLGSEPIPNTVVSFLPRDGGTPGVATTDRDGRFVVSTREKRGLAPGVYDVVVEIVPPQSSPDPDVEGPGQQPSPPPRPTVPKRYGSPETSRLSIEVQRQPNTVSLDLENR